jgi:hypothetical protein
MTRYVVHSLLWPDEEVTRVSGWKYSDWHMERWADFRFPNGEVRTLTECEVLEIEQSNNG